MYEWSLFICQKEIYMYIQEMFFNSFIIDSDFDLCSLLNCLKDVQAASWQCIDVSNVIDHESITREIINDL